MIQNQNLFWLSWIVFLLSAAAILLGGFILLKAGHNRGLYYNWVGFMGLAISGFLMTIAYGVPGG